MSSANIQKPNSLIHLNLILTPLFAILLATFSHAQQLRQGISVQMAPTTHALAYV
jgi:hypothetical protein